MPATKATTLTFRLEPSFKETLCGAADRDHRSIANTVAVMMSEHCASVGIPIKDKHEPALRRQPNQSPVSDMSQP